MTSHPMMRALLAVVGLCSLSARPGLAQSTVVLDSAFLPTSTVVSSPIATSFVATDYVFPTTYSPTYLSTSYLAPSYVTTTRYRPRRYVERTSYFASPSYLATSAYRSPAATLVPTTYLATSSYLPTTYVSSSYLPTAYVSSSPLLPTAYVLNSGLIATAATASSPICCDSPSSAPVQATTTNGPASSPPANTGSGTNPGTVTSKPMGTSAPAPERSPSAAIADPPADDRAGDSSVSTQSTTPAPVPPRPAPAPTGTATGDPSSPPPVPAAGEPVLPGPGQIGPKMNETQYRGARKPATYSEVRNILKGRVVSYESGRPEEGVTVVVSSMTNTFSDRTAMSDADGNFKLSLPEGDWIVKVQMPSGRVLAVGREYVTATSGRVTDPSGRNVPELVITR